MMCTWPNPSTNSTSPRPGHPDARGPPPPGPRTAGPWLVGAAVTAVLLLLAGRYGYHRDELYFLLCGRHLDWGYVDQGPLVPALARRPTRSRRATWWCCVRRRR